ncbi:MAG: tripartite tricarboxylate transporter substrate binding protein [Betaproteobacteria bacterium]|nr:MAG: tripartite tricarboxylate transporter substrate binding protein [Betaproteobacteria bacterium]
MTTLRGLAIGFAGVLAMMTAPAMAAGYPDKPVEMVVAGNAGGGLDLTGRAMETALREAKLFPQTFVIKNVGGAGGNVARTQVNQKKGDGHVLYVESNRIYVNRIVGTTPLTHKDVTPIGRLITEYVAWVVRADSPFKSPQDIFDKLKQNPESVPFGVGTVPSNDQMNILRPVMASGIDPKKIKVVSFKSGGDLMIQLLGGHVPVISTGLSEAIEQVKAGKARVIAVSAPQPLPGDLAKVPTWRSLGIDVAILHWRGVFAPPGISKDVIAYWDKALGQMVKTDAWKQQLEKHGWFDAYADSATFRKDLDAEEKIYTEILTDLGMAKGLKK